MSAAREAILGRIRQALRDVPEAEDAEDVDVPRPYRHRGELDGTAVVERFADRVRDYHAAVRVVEAADVAAAVTAACRERELARVIVPAGLDITWRPEGIRVVEDHDLSAHELDAIDGAVTGCAAAIAETGTIVLDGGAASGRRIVTLVPDHHICIVRSEQVFELVPEGLAAVAPAVREGRAPITLVSGPSASSDIELSRVEGVHGPRHLLVLIVAPRAAPTAPPAQAAP